MMNASPWPPPKPMPDGPPIIKFASARCRDAYIAKFPLPDALVWADDEQRFA